MSDGVSRVLAAGGREGLELQAAENGEEIVVGPRVPEPERGQLVALLESLDAVVFNRRPHRTTLVRDHSGDGVVHEKICEEKRTGKDGRTRMISRCSHPDCADRVFRGSKEFENHVEKTMGDLCHQESPDAVLWRSGNFAPQEPFDTKPKRRRRVLDFIEARHALSVARQHEDEALQEAIKEKMRFHIRLTNIFREADPTSRLLFQHYRRHFTDATDGVSTAHILELVVNVAFCFGTMGLHAVRMLQEGTWPWLRVEEGKITQESQDAMTAVYVRCGPGVFFQHVQPMQGRARLKTQGWLMLVAEMALVARCGGGGGRPIFLSSKND